MELVWTALDENLTLQDETCGEINGTIRNMIVHS